MKSKEEITGYLGGLLAGMVLGMIVPPKPYPPKNRLNVENVGKSIALMIAFLVVLYLPKLATTESDFLTFDNSFMSNINIQPVNFRTTQQNPVYDELNELSSLYTQKAMVYYNDLAAITSTMETSYNQLQQLKDLQGEIQAQITSLQAKKTSVETAIVTQNLTDIFIDLHEITQLIIALKQVGTYDQYANIQQKIYEVYSKTVVFTDNLSIVYQTIR